MRYPAVARDNRWEGDVLIAVMVSANGRASVNISASSGHDILDRQALAIYREATRLVSIPAALRGKESALRPLPVEYRLTD
jgi:periplasmic protein TonB